MTVIPFHEACQRIVNALDGVTDYEVVPSVAAPVEGVEDFRIAAYLVFHLRNGRNYSLALYGVPNETSILDSHNAARVEEALRLIASRQEEAS